MDFFRGMNLARALILLCLVAAGGLGYWAFQNQKRVDDLRSKLGLDEEWTFRESNATWIENQVGEAQRLAVEYTNSSKALEDEGLTKNEDPTTYIRGKASHPKIRMGRLSITPNQERQRGYTDRKYRIQPDNKGSGRNSERKTFDRTQIANFLYKLEETSSRLRVTSFNISPIGRVEFDKYPTDEWDFDCTITIREKTEAGS